MSELIYIVILLIFSTACIGQILKSMLAQSWEWEGWGTFIKLFSLLIVIYVAGAYLISGRLLGGIAIIIPMIIELINDMHHSSPTSLWMEIAFIDFLAFIIILLSIWTTSIFDDGNISSDGFETALPIALQLFIYALIINTIGLFIKLFKIA